MNIWLIGLLVRFGFAILFLITGIIIASRYATKVGMKSFVAYYLFRLISMAGLFYVMNQLPPDVHGWYQHALWMNEGYFPGQDFLSPYYLGFNFLLFLSIFIFNSPFSIIILFTIIEALSLILLFKGLVKVYDELISKKIIILYITSPITTFTAWFAAQDEVLLLLGTVILLNIIIYNKSLLSFFVITYFSVFFTKIFSIFYLQPFCLYKRWKSSALGVLSLVLYIGLSKFFNMDPFCMQFGRGLGLEIKGDQIAYMLTPGSLWYLFPKVPIVIMKMSFFICICIVSIFFFPDFLKKNRSRNENVYIVSSLLCVWYLIFNIFYPMTFTSYAIPIIPFILILMTYFKSFKMWTILYSWFCIMVIKEQITSLPRVLNVEHVLLQTFIFSFESSVVLLSVVLLTYILFRHISIKTN